MNTFDAYYEKQTPGNACRLAATDHREQGLYNLNFIDDLNKAGELADNAPALIAMLERLLCRCKNLDQSATHEGLENCQSIAEARALIAKIKGE